MSLHDPFAILGVSILASNQEIFRRFEFVSFVLNPERLQEMSDRNRSFAQTRLEQVHQAFEDLTDSRAETLSELRSFVVQNRPKPEGAIAKLLSSLRKRDILDVYDAAIVDLAQLQYTSRHNAIQITPKLTDLNLTYLALMNPPGSDEGGARVPNLPRVDPPEFGAEADPDLGLSSVP